MGLFLRIFGIIDGFFLINGYTQLSVKWFLLNQACLLSICKLVLYMKNNGVERLSTSHELVDRARHQNAGVAFFSLKKISQRFVRDHHLVACC